jgi:peptide/nickel transport system substrate-binding protein
MLKNLKIFIVVVLGILILIACRQPEATDSPAATLAPANDNAVTDAAGSAEASPTTETSAVASSPTTEPEPTPEPEPTAVPTATPIPAKELVVCVAGEPTSLFLYGDNSLTAVAIRHALYENLYVSLDYAYQPQGLVSLPVPDSGDVRIETVLARADDRVLDANGSVVRLVPGVVVENAAGERQTFERNPIEMQQMVVEFTFQPLVWSDGTPVTADDSVFSFEIAANPLTPGVKTKTERTAVYEATGDRTVRWTGVPGFIDSGYTTNVWTPLPRHQLGDVPLSELAALPEAAQMPLSHGPFVVDEWLPGEMIHLLPNPHYYRAAEGLPKLESVLFRLNMTAEEALAGDCDIITQDVIGTEQVTAVLDAEAAGQWVVHVANSPIFEHVAFGIEPIEEYARTRPDWFGDARTRQALTMCIDRQRMVDELAYGRSQIMHTFTPADHPLYPADVTQWPYDPAQANALLDELGYTDSDGDGVRDLAAEGATDEETAVPFRIRLSADTNSPLRARVVEMIQADLAQCGVAVDLDFRPPAEFYGDGPLGSLFGRRFDLGALAWRAGVQPPCQLWLSDNITGSQAEGFGGWGNINPTGWRSDEYDTACRTALRALPGAPDYDAAHQTALNVFSQELPGIPLFTLLKVAATQPYVLNFQMDGVQTSELWNLAELDLSGE